MVTVHILSNRLFHRSIQVYVHCRYCSGWCSEYCCVCVHLSSNTESSLGLHNLNTALETLPDEGWRDFGWWGLNVPLSKCNEIRSQYSSDGERKSALLQTYLTSHPAPSWQHVAEALYRCGYLKQVHHTVLERVQRMFPTGKKIYSTFRGRKPGGQGGA